MSNAPEIAEYEARLRRALALLRHTRARLDAHEGGRREPLAVVGVACRFPGADAPDAFWRLLQQGTDAIRRVPPDRWDADAYYDPDLDAPGKMCTRHGGFLETVDRFDRQFFGISPREARCMDPQQLLLLEVTWEALEDALIAPDALDGAKAGVFMGIAGADHSLLQMKHGDARRIDAYFATGNASSAAAGRLSYTLGMRGPNLAVDTACSSSLVAVHLACQSLRAGECRVALAGAVNVILIPEVTINFSKARMIAPDGRCKTFDDAADGFIRGEGCGVIVLKRLSDALADGDSILALIRGSAVNQDGRSSGLTVPNGVAQQEVIREALANAGVDPHDVGYVEAHGTGTPLGDPIEVNALAAALCEGRPRDRRLRIGSVKTNLGHLEATAGMAGLIKVALALHHEEIPPHLHLVSPSSKIPWSQLAVDVPTQRTPWPRGESPRIAGVSSFGFSGTNAHVVLEEAPPPPQDEAPAPEPAAHLLVLSTKSEETLRELAGRYARHLAERPGLSLADVCWSARAGRALLSHRLSVAASSRPQMIERLSAFAAGERPAGVRSGTPESGRSQAKIAFLFTGQGAQYAGMGRGLCESQPVFRDALERCDALLRPHLARPLLSVLYPAPGERTPLDETAYTQPALFALGYALAELWRSFGVEPAIVAGHSVGEYTAACVAGLLRLEEGLRLIAARGRLMQALPRGGAMAAVFASEERVEEALAPHAASVAIAAQNGPTETVISGDQGAVRAVVEALSTQGIRCEELRVSHAFHSPHMDPMLDAFEREAAGIDYGPLRCDLVSSVTGRRARGELAQPGYWRQQVRSPVRFSAALQSLRAEGASVFVEIGPKPALLGMMARCLPDDPRRLALPSLRKDRHDLDQMLESVGALHVSGVPIAWAAVGRARRRRVPLPTTPFLRRPYREPAPASPSPPNASEVAPLGGPAVRAGGARSDWLYDIRWSTLPAPLRSEPAGACLLLADRSGVGARLAERLTARGERCVLATLAAPGDSADPRVIRLDPARPEHFARLAQEAAAGASSLRIVHLASLDAGAPSSADALLASQVLASCSALSLVQALSEQHGAAALRMYLVTRGACAVGSDAVDPVQAPLWGLGAAIRLERPELRCVNVDLDPAPDVDAAAALFDELCASDREEQVALRREGARLSPRLARCDAEMPPLTALRPDGTYLITGGLGGLGLVVARWMVDRGAKHLVLMGRSAPSEHASRAIAAMERDGARVRVIRGDVAREEAVAAALSDIRSTMAPLAGVVHSAGVLRDAMLTDQRWESFAEVLSPKACGAYNLHVQTQGLPIEMFALFSSAWSLLGAPGQSNYVAANAYLDALAHHRRALGLPAVSIHWGPWSEVGAAIHVKQQSWRRLAAVGMGTIDPASAPPLLDRLLRCPTAEVAVLPIHWAKFMDQFPPGGGPRLLADVAPGAAPAARAAGAAGLVERLRRAPPSTHHDLLVDHLQREVARIMDLGASELPSPHQRLFDLGLDSLMAVELKNRLQTELGRTLQVSALFNYPTIDALAGYLIEHVVPAPSAGSAAAAASQPETGAALRAKESATPAGQAAPEKSAELAKIEQLSEAELDAMLLQITSERVNKDPLTP